VYRCADLSRTFVPVVALLLAADSTGAFAREFRASDPHSRRFGVEKGALERIRTGATDLNRTNVALIGTMTPLLIGRLHRVEQI